MKLPLTPTRAPRSTGGGEVNVEVEATRDELARASFAAALLGVARTMLSGGALPGSVADVRWFFRAARRDRNNPVVAAQAHKDADKIWKKYGVTVPPDLLEDEEFTDERVSTFWKEILKRMKHRRVQDYEVKSAERPFFLLNKLRLFVFHGEDADGKWKGSKTVDMLA